MSAWSFVFFLFIKEADSFSKNGSSSSKNAESSNANPGPPQERPSRDDKSEAASSPKFRIRSSEKGEKLLKKKKKNRSRDNMLTKNDPTYLNLSQSVHENLLAPNVQISGRRESKVGKILHNSLQNGDSAQKYMQGSRSKNIDNCVETLSQTLSLVLLEMILFGPLQLLNSAELLRCHKLCHWFSWG